MNLKTPDIVRGNPLAIRILLVILAASTLFASLVYGTQLFVSYRQDNRALFLRLQDAEKTFLPAVNDALWKLDRELLQLTVDNVTALPFIDSARLDSKEATIVAGDGSPNRFSTFYSYELSHLIGSKSVILGTFTVELDRTGVINNLKKNAMLLLALQALKTLVLSALILLILHLMLFRYLQQLRGRAKQLSLTQLEHSFLLDRQGLGVRDELSEFSDVLERMRVRIKAGLEELQATQHQARQIRIAADASSSGVCIFDASGAIHYHNRQFYELLVDSVADQPQQQWIEQLLRIIDSGIDLVTFLRNVRTTGLVQEDLFCETRDNEPKWLSVRVITYRDEGAEYFMLTLVDTTAARNARQREKALRERDSLTELPNRTLGLELFQQRCRDAATNDLQFGVVIFSIDGYKPTFESLGLQYADLLLVKSTRAIQALLPPNSLLARTADNELMAVVPLPRPDTLQLEELLISLREHFSRPLELQNHEVNAQFYAGIALYPTDGETAAALHRCAMSALAQAQQHEPRERYRFYHSELSQSSARRLRLSSLITSGWVYSSMELYYQPIIAAQSGEPVGFEALLRCNEPELGWIAPPELIEIAEQVGQIDKLGLWILETACDEAVTWSNKRENLFVSVNVSPTQLEHPEFVDRVFSALKDSGLPHQRLKLEITEQVIMRSHQNLLEKLHQLSDSGIHLAIDDFGTGFASLNYLSDYPFNVLKLDQSFVFRLQESGNIQILIKSMTELSHNLGLQVVAEGVETIGLSEFCAKLGCDLLQGYYFSRPLPAQQVPSYLNNGKPLSIEEALPIKPQSC